MYIISMRTFFVLFACLCGLAFGQPNWDNPKCYELDRIIDELDMEWMAKNDDRYAAAAWSLFGGVFTKCECVEKTACGKANLCTSYKCPNDDEVVSVFDGAHRFAAKIIGSAFSFGSGGHLKSDK
jgi:hypothetical protein